MELRKISVDEFEKIYSIMEAAFPKDERRPYEKQKLCLDNPKYSIAAISDTDSEPLGFIAYHCFDSFVFIEHFAISSKHRNMGIGGKMLAEFINKLNMPVCLEVEPPTTDLAKRRIEFYKKHGFFLNDYPYIQPPMSEGQASLPLLIMTTQKPLTSDEFKKVRSTLHKEVYKVNTDDYI